ncbi:MAG: MarR family transcriptional regulator [Firmicutes bacterium]|nr:MarR family transcriptional regulator [Bacillota bacterium]
MTPQEIRALLILKRVSQRQIARRLKVTDAAVSQVISGLEKNQRIRQSIAEALDMPASKIWPSKNGLR